MDGERDVLGLCAGEHGDGEGAKFSLRVSSEIKNRGVRDVCMLVCDGLNACPRGRNVWEKTIVQTRIVHLLLLTASNSAAISQPQPRGGREDPDSALRGRLRG